MKKLIGKGAFTKAYLLDSGEVELQSIDPIKECMALWGFGDSRLWPEIERIECRTNGVQVFRMPYYDRPKSLKNNLTPNDYSFYKDLRSLTRATGLLRGYQLKQHWHDQFDSLKAKWPEHVAALHEVLDAIANYGEDICFEISPRNVAVKDGKLILLDCFFLRSVLMGVNNCKSLQDY
jgi:hypothetical protein